MAPTVGQKEHPSTEAGTTTADDSSKPKGKAIKHGRRTKRTTPVQGAHHVGQIEKSKQCSESAINKRKGGHPYQLPPGASARLQG